MEHFQTSFKLNFVTQPMYLWAICLTKISVGFFLLRIANRPFYRRLIISIMSKFECIQAFKHLDILVAKVDLAFMAFYTTGCFFTIVLQCTDLRVQWDQTVKGTCWTGKTIKSLSYTNQALNIGTDIAFSVGIPVSRLPVNSPVCSC
jgi:hypothetical protein